MALAIPDGAAYELITPWIDPGYMIEMADLFRVG